MFTFYCINILPMALSMCLSFAEIRKLEYREHVGMDSFSALILKNIVS